MALPREAAWRNRLCGRARREERRCEQLCARRSKAGESGSRARRGDAPAKRPEGHRVTARSETIHATIGVTTRDFQSSLARLSRRDHATTVRPRRLSRFFNQLNDIEKVGDSVLTKLAGQRLKAESAAVPRRDFSLASLRTRRHQRAHTGVERAFTSSVQSPPPYQEGHRPVLR